MGNRFIRRADACVIIEKLCVKAVMERKLIQPGDRVMIGASGGKDSTVMAWALSRLKQIIKTDYVLEAVHVSGDFGGGPDRDALAKNLLQWGVPLTSVDVPVVGRLKPGRKMNCYWCSTQRRTELLRYAAEHGFNKIALGHHLDDIIETYFMNLLNKGETETMPILLAYKKYPVSLIRPLAYIEEKQIVDCASRLGIMGSVCTCPWGENSGRREIREKIAALTDNSSAVKRRIFEAASGRCETAG